MGLVTGLALAAGSAIASSVKANQAKKAAQGAANAQNEALDKVQTIDTTKLAQTARDADIKKYTEQFDLLDQVDPATGQIRDVADAGLLENLNDSNTQNSNALLQQLFGENVNLSPEDAAFAAQLKAEAKRQLDLGGQLSPEQQAEFVRAGLEQGAGAGFQAGSSALRQGVGKLLASEQEALANNRRNMAQQLFGFATDLNTTRLNNLSGLSRTSRDASTTQFGKLASLANLADSRVPDVGLSGGDIANLEVANNDIRNNTTLQKGGVAANAINAKGAANAGLAAGLIGAVGQGITGYKQAKLDKSINAAKIAGALMGTR